MDAQFGTVGLRGGRMARVTILGSGDAFGAGGRLFGTYLVETEATTLLLECGPTVLQGLKRVACDPARIDGVFVSHLHGDHFGGIPFLFMEYRYQTPRTRPIAIYGPSGICDGVTDLFGALYHRIATTDSPFPVTFGEATPGAPIRFADVVVEPFAVSHVSELVCLGYRLRVGGKIICFSGDSGWGPELADAARGADLFLCECSTYDTQLDIHVSYPEIAAEAAGLGCGRVVLTHLGDEVLARAEHLALECATDGMTIDV